MTKFEEEFEHELDYFIERELSLDEKLSFGARDVLVKFFSGWHSPEHIEKEIQMKLLKLQQQALPVVPECVAKDVKRLSLSTLADWNVAVSYISKETLEWLSTTGNINVFLGKSWTLCSLKINGFKVEKPQLFYLKHIDMSKNDEQVDWYMSKSHRRVGHNACDKGKLPIYGSFKFTQQEIDSMQTGSYEQIEVTE